MTSDPRPGDPGYAALRQSILDLRRSDRDRWRRLDQQMEASDRAIAALVEREKDAAKAQAAADVLRDLPEPADEPAGEVVPTPAGDPDAELLTSSPWGEPYQAWRRDHVASTNPFQI